MNSCAYVCRLWHNRPGKNEFAYNIYMYYLDLDELDQLSEKLSLFSYNRWNVMSFHDDDHFLFVRQKGKADKIARETFDYTRRLYNKKDTKERVRTAIHELNLGFDLGKVFILTNVRNLGYIFNPVSFYYCYDTDGKFRALLSEVNNTFRDQKLYHTKVNARKKTFYDKQKKNFYISPFIDSDTEIRWKFREPGAGLFMQVNTFKDEKPILQTQLTGTRKELTNRSVTFLFMRYPMMPLMAIILIHWQALKLFLKRVRFRQKGKTDKQIIRRLR